MHSVWQQGHYYSMSPAWCPIVPVERMLPSSSSGRREYFRLGGVLVLGEPQQVGGSEVGVWALADLHAAQTLVGDAEADRCRGDGDGERLAALAEPAAIGGRRLRVVDDPEYLLGDEAFEAADELAVGIARGAGRAM